MKMDNNYTVLPFTHIKDYEEERRSSSESKYSSKSSGNSIGSGKKHRSGSKEPRSFSSLYEEDNKCEKRKSRLSRFLPFMSTGSDRSDRQSGIFRSKYLSSRAFHSQKSNRKLGVDASRSSLEFSHSEDKDSSESDEDRRGRPRGIRDDDSRMIYEYKYLLFVDMAAGERTVLIVWSLSLILRSYPRV